MWNYEGTWASDKEAASCLRGTPMRHLISTFALLALCLSQISAHEIRPPFPGPIIIEPPRIKVPPAETPIQLQSMKVDVRIVGLHAETTQTLRFYNPNHRILAGDLECALPSGAVVSGYALDINGRMVDGVIVGKQKARMIMDTEQRRRVDPGLVEHVRGNVFNTRVYPIPAQGTRTIKIVYVSELAFKGNDAAYQLPLPQKETVAQLDLSIAIAKSPVAPEIGGFGNVKLTDWDDQWKAQASFKNLKANDNLWIKLPNIPQQLIDVETFGGQQYLSVLDRFTHKVMKVAKRKRVAVAWDASSSHDGQARLAEIAVLEEALKQWPGCTIDVLVFRNDVEKQVKSFGNINDLRTYLQQLPYDGATDLSKLDFRASALPHADVEAWLLFSDGLHTLGNGTPKTDRIPVYTLTASQRHDQGYLRFIAAMSGGAHITLRDQDIKAAVEICAGQQLGLVRVDDPQQILQDIQIVNKTEAGLAHVYAKLLRHGTIHLIYRGDNNQEIKKEVMVNVNNVKESHILARAWAAQKAQVLALFPERNKNALVALGNQYNLVTPGTSLLVLENLNQYLRHGVQPPASWPEMRNQYDLALKRRANDRKRFEQDKLTRVIGWWQQRVNWWNRDFNVPKDFRFHRKGAAKAAEDAPAEANVMALADGVDEETDAAAPAPEMAQNAREGSGRRRAVTRSGGAILKKEKKQNGMSAHASMVVKRWNPNTPYLTAIKAAPAGGHYNSYLAQRSAYASSPGFYLDCAGYFIDFDLDVGLRILSNLAEMKIENAALLRVYAWRLQEAGELDRALEIFERVRTMRSDEPQSHRDVALLLIQRYNKTAQQADALRAVRLLYDVVINKWQRFEQIEVLALTELNALLAKMPVDLRQQCQFIDARVQQHLPVDVRIVLSWDADNTDIDLHVHEPSGEVAKYSHNRTYIGGFVSRDFTQGYGPEDYFVKKAMTGEYKIYCHYYGSRQQTLVGPCTVTATVYTNYGRPDEQKQVLTLRLNKPRDTYLVGSITIGADMIKPQPLPRPHVKKPVQVHDQISLDTIKALKIGMTKEEVIRSLGYKGQESNNGMNLLSYALNDGTRVRLAFGPDLLWAHQIQHGAEISLLSR